LGCECWKQQRRPTCSATGPRTTRPTAVSASREAEESVQPRWKGKRWWTGARASPVQTRSVSGFDIEQHDHRSSSTQLWCAQETLLGLGECLPSPKHGTARWLWKTTWDLPVESVIHTRRWRRATAWSKPGTIIRSWSQPVSFGGATHDGRCSGTNPDRGVAAVHSDARRSSGSALAERWGCL
jgi:hypothetical protein